MTALDLSGENDDGVAGELKPAPEPDRAKRRRGARKSTKPRTVRTDRKPSEADLKKRIDDGLVEVIAFVNDWLGWTDVAEAMQDDRQRMAEVLAARATRHARLGVWLTRVFGKDSLLSFARAFGPTLRALRNHYREWRAARAEADPGFWVDAEGYVVDAATGQRTGERATVA